MQPPILARRGDRDPIISKQTNLAFIDEMRAEAYATESNLRVLPQQGLPIAARTYRSWKQPARIAVRTFTDALVEDKIRDLAWRATRHRAL